MLRPVRSTGRRVLPAPTRTDHQSQPPPAVASTKATTLTSTHSNAPDTDPPRSRSHHTGGAVAPSSWQETGSCPHGAERDERGRGIRATSVLGRVAHKGGLLAPGVGGIAPLLEDLELDPVR